MPVREEGLPLSHQQRYEAFRRTIGQAQQLLQDANRTGLQSSITALQQFFRDQLLSLPTDELSSATQQWVQSYQVEMDKQLRLLGVDVLFLQSARQAATAAQRQQQVRDRLDTLQRYCEAMMGESEE